jgi:hypothetical protein
VTSGALNPAQFSPPGDDQAKAALHKQLKGDFPRRAREWLDDPAITVDAPARVAADDVDWSDYSDWEAARQLKEVRKIAKDKKVAKGGGKPSVMVATPGADDLDIIDGHHHALARVDLQQDPLAYVVHVPSSSGAWQTMHDHGKTKPDDFGKKKGRK